MCIRDRAFISDFEMFLRTDKHCCTNTVWLYVCPLRTMVFIAIDNEMKQRGEDHVYLDVTHKDPEETKKHFPNIYKKCLSIGIDLSLIHILSPLSPIWP